MINKERGTEAEQEFTILVPIEGYPGLYTYKDITLPDKEDIDRMLAEARTEMLIDELPEDIKDMDLTEMELVPLDGYPGLFTYRRPSSK